MKSVNQSKQTSYCLLKLADTSQCCPMLLRVGNAAVTPVPPQLVAEVLNTVSLRLRTNLALRRERREQERWGEERRGEERIHVCWTYIEPFTASLLTACRGFILHSFLVPKVKLTTEQRGPHSAEITVVWQRETKNVRLRVCFSLCVLYALVSVWAGQE